MKIAVITPYYQPEDDIFKQCLDSVAAQSFPCTHILVSDGHPNPLVARRGLTEIHLPHAHGVGGNFPRCIGALMAVNEGYDAIAFLDEDNWFTPNHLQVMLDLYTKSAALICTARRTIHRMDGSMMPVTDLWSDGDANTDTNCMFLTRPAFPLLSTWVKIPPELGAICDRIYWSSIKQNAFRTAHAAIPTVRFRSLYQVHYDFIKEPAPLGAKSSEDVNKPILWLRGLPDKERNHWRSVLGVQ
jgi:hypothetical protein